MNKRMKLHLVILAILLTLTVAWSYGSMARSRRLAAGVTADTLECQRLTASIERLSAQPSVASEHERRIKEITDVIEASAGSAGIPANRLIRIAPQPSQRVADSAYKDKPTLVLLKNITLKQLVGMAHGILSSDQGLGIKSIRLRAVRQEDPSDSWDVDIVATYLIYEPRQQGS